MTLQSHVVFELVNVTYLTLVAELNNSIVEDEPRDDATADEQGTEASTSF